jgi:hypothetical protein
MNAAAPGGHNRFRRRPVLSLLTSLAAILLAAELGLRVWSPGALQFSYSFRRVVRYHDRWYVDLIPDTSSTVRWQNGRGVHVLNFLLTVGRYGFRTHDRELDGRPSPGSGKFIHAIGDSFTMGWGVNYDSSYPARLDFDLPPDLRVLNLGLAGFGTVAAVEKSRALSDLFPPAAVVYLFHPNDYGDDERAARWARLPGIAHRAADVANELRRHTYLANLPFAAVWWLRRGSEADAGEDDFRTEKLSAASPLALTDARRGDSPSDPTRGAVSKEALLRHARFLSERGAPLIVLSLHPRGNTRDFDAFCRENGIESHLLEAPKELFLIHEGHLNQLGNQQLAFYVAAILKRRLGGGS